MITPERIEELNAKLEKCPHGLYGVCLFCDEHARKVRICGWGALAWIIASLLALCALAVLSCQGAENLSSPQWSSGETQSRPFPARAVKIMGKSGAYNAQSTESESQHKRETYNVPSKSGLTAGETAISSKFYDALAQVESGNRNIPGDHGRSVGPYQFTVKAWEQANRLRTAAMLPIGSVVPLPYKLAHDLRMATLMAEYYCTWLERGLARTLRRKPTVSEIYAAYNLGPSGFRQFGNKIKNTPRTTQLPAAKMERLMR